MRDMIAFVIVGLLSLVGLAWAGQQVYASMQNTKVANSVADVQLLATNIQGMYNTTNNYSTLTNTVVLNAKDAAPAEMIVGGALVDQWGGAVTIVPGTTWSYAATQFGISITPPQTGCTKILSSIKATAYSVTGNPFQTYPVDPGTIAADCAAHPGAALKILFN